MRCVKGTVELGIGYVASDSSWHYLFLHSNLCLHMISGCRCILPAYPRARASFYFGEERGICECYTGVPGVVRHKRAGYWPAPHAMWWVAS